MAELVDARDLKSLGVYLCESSILSPGTRKSMDFRVYISEILFFGGENPPSPCNRLQGLGAYAGFRSARNGS